MTIFLITFLTKYSLKRTKLHHFLKFSRGSMPPNPPLPRVQEFARIHKKKKKKKRLSNLKAKFESLFFFFFFFFFFAFQFIRGGGPAQKLAEKMTISTKKVAKYR